MFSELPLMFSAGLLLILMFVVGYMALKVRIPGVIIFILLGLVLGRFITDDKILHFAGEIGIVILFFMLGMEFPISRLAGIAKKVAPAGFLDVVLSLGVSMLLCLAFGLDWITSFLIGGVVYATSSSITAKMLESTKRMANTESEFILALLIFEDLVAPIVVAILVGLTAGHGLTGGDLTLLLLKIVALTIGAILLGKLIFSKLGGFFERYLNNDLFILLIVGIALGYGGLALYLDLSEVLGAFLAGIIIAEVRKTEALEHLLLPVRDLTLPLFFFYFGTTITFGEGISNQFMLLLALLLLWSIIAKVIVGIVGGRWFGLSKRVAFKSGLSLTQRGEFSVIIASLATGMTKLLSSMFILSSAMIGIILFLLAPKITDKVFGERKRREKIKVPS